MTTFEDNIKLNISNLKNLMESNTHLNDHLTVSNAINSAAKFPAFLSKQDVIFINDARKALKNQTPWKANG